MLIVAVIGIVVEARFAEQKKNCDRVANLMSGATTFGGRRTVATDRSIVTVGREMATRTF